DEVEEEEEPDDSPSFPARKSGSYRSKQAGGKGGIGKILVIATVFALVVGAVVGGVLIYLDSKKGKEQAANEKKDDKKGPETTAPDTPVPKDEKKGTEPPSPRSADKNQPKKDSLGKKAVVPITSGAM